MVFVLFLAALAAVANGAPAPSPCLGLASCEACTAEWTCVWCPGAVVNGSASGCMDGSIFGQSECSGTHYQWRQCTFAGWILLLMISGGVAIVLLVIVCICCCCCCRRKRRRNVEYNQLENPVYEVKSTPVPTPKTNEWREKMSAKYGIGQSKSSATEDVWN